MEKVTGFSKLSKEEKVNFIADLLSEPEKFKQDLEDSYFSDEEMQIRIDNFSENSIGNYMLPFSIAPNFLINCKMYNIPMVTEESSVVAAASSAAGFWAKHGGFRTKVLNTLKNGQIFFTWNGPSGFIKQEFISLEKYMTENIHHLISKMVERGGGISGMHLIDMSSQFENLFQIRIHFETADSMGANFINSCLEEMSEVLIKYLTEKGKSSEKPEIIMAILSNYNPECLVESELCCKIEDLDDLDPKLSARQFAEKFKLAVDIAGIDLFRAVTHNKGILNGIDSVVIATGNDFRAVEAAVHAFAARDGSYRSLSYANLSEDTFRFGLRIPLSVGTVGGITRIHPISEWSHKILGNPDAGLLMQIIASAGLANNFSAIRSLITKGIQHGHMKLQLSNILNILHASKEETEIANEHFKSIKVTYSSVNEFLTELRKT